MKPSQRSHTLLSITRSRAKMVEYAVPPEHYFELPQDPAKLFTLSIGILGDVVASSNRAAASPEEIRHLKEHLNFSAYFFDAYVQSRLNQSLDPYVALLASSAYYLCDLPGAARVLAHKLEEDCPNLEGEGLEGLLLWLLRGDVSYSWNTYWGYFQNYVTAITSELCEFFQGGTSTQRMFELTKLLRNLAYEEGSPRQLLLADVICAVVQKKYDNSTWHSIPKYSGLDRELWIDALKKDSFIRELWPAQHLLGQHNVLQGASAIVQMPTSAGKTKATELIIRSSFLSGRTSLAVIVAPFRALCHEIKNSLLFSFKGEHVNVDALSDVLQSDFDLLNLLGGKQVIVVTPEKLVYVLRHAPQLAENVGLVIFDEGHQFDSGKRGITYELLVTSLTAMLPAHAQKVLISAVISNAESLGEWLNGTDSEVVEGTNLLPTLRSVGFASWLDTLGQIHFVQNSNPDQLDYFVPRVLEQSKLPAKKGEKIDRFFPDKAEGKSIALYLGLKLSMNGGIAIFCGRKQTAASVCEQAVEIFERGGLPLNSPAMYADADELRKIHYLCSRNLGAKAIASKSALLGIFPHHGNTPHGIRLAIEHSMREGLIHFVVCTSTLAQGVNLPIRYLIVSGIYQDKEPIMVRDFHNLIGRAGRAGMHTEGSVIFADPEVYDRRKVFKERWRWQQIKKLLDPSNSEPCISKLLSIFEPIKNDRGDKSLSMQALAFVRAYIRSPNEIVAYAASIAQQNEGYSEGRVREQIVDRVLLISAVESFLMSHWDSGSTQSEVAALATSTLAYFLADEKTKKLIIELFELLADNIAQTVQESSRKMVYGKTLYGVMDLHEIESWIYANFYTLYNCETPGEALEAIWPLLSKYISNKNFQNCDKPATLKEVTEAWIGGSSFQNLLDLVHRANAKRNWGTKKKKYSIDDMVDICEGGVAYSGALLVGAVSELLELIPLDEDESIDSMVSILQLLQKCLKYGLPNESSCSIYELGFADRVIAQEIAASLGLTNENRKGVKGSIKGNSEVVEKILEKYPSFFAGRLHELD